MAEVSGIFLTVWDDEGHGLLRTTSGGYPHITVAYTGDTIDQDDLVGLAQRALYHGMNQTGRITKATVNSFTKETAAGPVERHDVLLSVDAELTGTIGRIRTVLARPLEGAAMHAPHITTATCAKRADAEVEAARINVRLAAGPARVRVVGVTMD